MLQPDSGRRYEVSALRNKRWLIDCLARTEAEARARAEELYADEGNDAVRVVRARFGGDGTSFETVILERARPPRRGEQPVRLAASPSEEAWCETLADIYGPASRRAVARLLRNFLDRHSITPTELLHHDRYIRMLERQDTLLTQAVQRMATVQARARGIDAKQRLDTLDRLVAEASSRARDALQSRAAPLLGEDSLVALAEKVAELARAPEDQAFYIRVAVSRAFEDLDGFSGRMETVMRWAAAPKPPPLVALIDELVAGLFGAASLVQELLGAQPHLASALMVLADLASGRCESELPPTLAPLGAMLRQSGMPETRAVLVDRLLRELAGEKPLSRDDLAGQRRLFETLLDKLVDPRGIFVGGGAMVEALARRSRRFEIIGGIEEARFSSSDPVTRLDELLVLAAGVLSERQQRGFATCMVELLDAFVGDPALLQPLRPRLDGLHLPAAAKAAVIACWPLPAALERAAG